MLPIGPTTSPASGNPSPKEFTPHYRADRSPYRRRGINTIFLLFVRNTRKVSRSARVSRAFPQKSHRAAITNIAHAIPVVAESCGQPVAHVATVATHAQVFSIRALRVHCQSCTLRGLCLPVGLSVGETEQLDRLVLHRNRFKRNETLYRAGDPFRALYAIRMGSIKTTMLAEDGREQIVGYHMMGEIIGYDGVGTDRHTVGAIALEETDICALPFSEIENLARTVPMMQHNLHQFMSREMMRDQGAMLMLGSMRGRAARCVSLESR